MSVDIFDILDGLEQILPVLGTMTGKPEIAMLAARLLDIGENEIQRRMAERPGATRAQVLADTTETFQQFKLENVALKKLGHEND